jgi:hypothetical protein
LNAKPIAILAILAILAIPTTAGDPWIWTIERGPIADPPWNTTGIQWMCQPTEGNLSIDNLTGMDNLTWMAVYNLTTGQFEYLFSDGHGSEITLPYARGFACYITDNISIELDMEDMPDNWTYQLEPGLSLHGNPFPFEMLVSWMAAGIDENVTWIASWNSTSQHYEYFFPSDPGHSVDYMVGSCGGCWFYSLSDEPIDYRIYLD